MCGGGGIDSPVDRDDGPEGAHRVGAERAQVGLLECLRERHPRGRGVLDDAHGRPRRECERGETVERAVEVEVVVVRERLAVQLLETGQPHARVSAPAVEGRLLVRVLAVAQRTPEFGGQGKVDREHSGCARARGRLVRVRAGSIVLPGGPPQPFRHGVIVRTRVCKHLHRQLPAKRAGVFFPVEDREHARVVSGIHDGPHVGVVLGRRPDHGGSADIHLLHRVAHRHPALRHGLLEGVEVDRDQAHGRVAPCREGVVVVAVPAPGQDPRMDGRVQGLDPPVHHFRV